MQRFADRRDAGRALAEAMTMDSPTRETLVLALPRGGVPVAYEVARRFDLPLDVLIVRKVGLPSNPELAMGAVSSGGAVIKNASVITAYRVDDESFNDVVENELRELDRREKLYREGRAALDVSDRNVVLVDDGIATGSTMTAAVQALRHMGVKSITVAVPVAAPDSLTKLQGQADRVLSLASPLDFAAVGWFYEDFHQVEDEEVRHLLAEVRDG